MQGSLAESSHGKKQKAKEENLCPHVVDEQKRANPLPQALS
jgi:hypothetical protein